MLSNILKLSFNYGNIETGQLGLPITKNDLILPVVYMVNGQMINIIFEDNHLLVVEKPINIPVQEDKSKDKDLLSILKKY